MFIQQPLRPRVRGFVLALLVAQVLALGFAVRVRAADDDASTSYWFNVNPQHEITDKLSNFGNFGVYDRPNDYLRYEFGWPSFAYQLKPWVQLWAGINTYYTDNEGSANTLELRPYAGVKFVPPRLTIFRPYNLFRYEYRTTENLDTHDWSSYSRIRNRVGTAFPIASAERAWKPRSFYGFADVEIFYRFDSDEIDPLRVRGGLGYIFTERIHCELIYTASLTRSSSSQPLEHTGNTIELNVRLTLNKKLLARLFTAGD